MAAQTPPRPVTTRGDLRSMVVDHLQDRSRHCLAAGEARRRVAFRDGRWAEYGQGIRAHVRDAFGAMPFGAAGGPLKTRAVTAFDLGCCRVENLLFESFPGWEVNASVFVPRGKGPFPAIVIPVGHSGKQHDTYQVPAQAFASLGFLAVLFDPPGQDSEKRPGNDHFRDGVRTFLTGHSSNRYFVLDALRCIDYLETRSDADLRRGVGMTGVSGGGHTTLFAALFDARIACQGPSCCLTRLADHPVGDLYSACPESLWSGRLAAGVDELDVLLASIPTPALYMAGRRDEVFQIEWSRALAREAAAGFGAAGAAGRFAFFEDEGGHAYTLAQVRQFAAWMNRWVRQGPERPVPQLDAADFPMRPYDQLKCYPAPEENIFTLNRALARRQAAARPAARSAPLLRAAVEAVV
ncbi:MAG: acetylxylan esterase, partial [Gemmatimonadota bacterium]